MCVCVNIMYICGIPYSRKYWQSIKFGGLGVGEATVKFKSIKLLCTYVLFYACAHIICTELPPNLNPPKFFFFLAARDQTAKFKDRQYFRLYGMQIVHV